MRGFATLLYGIICYLLFFASFVYTIGFVGDFGVPLSIDHGRSAPAATAWAIDLALLALFAVQHSGMARRGFKAWLTRWLPAAAERSTYVLASTLVLILLLWQWRPLPGQVWQTSPPLTQVLWVLYACGWALVLTGSYVINHFDLFGLRQAWLRFRKRPYTPLRFQMRWYYRIVRHPLMLGFLIAFWATPSMTVGHLLFAFGTTGYILLALRLEERDLVAAHGDDYRRYQQEVPMLVPGMQRRTARRRPAVN